MYFLKKIKPRGVGVDVEYGGVRVQGRVHMNSI